MIAVTAFLVAQAADIATTEYLLRRGGREMNPLLPTRPGLHAAVKVPLVLAFAWYAPPVAVAVTAALTVFAVAWNARIVLRIRRWER